MSRIDFVIANDGHHTQAALPVLRLLKNRIGARCRLASICELRGIASPIDRYAEEGIPVEPLIPFSLRRSPTTGSPGGRDQDKGLRSIARKILWHTVIRSRVSKFCRTRPDLVVLPNDRAFPYGELCRWLVKRRIPTLVLQEGVRFATPAKKHLGASGATAFAVWGETSRLYYKERGEVPSSIHSTGAPRFDELALRDWTEEAQAVRIDLDLGKRNLLLLSNPIDDLGYISADEKLGLIRRFVAEQSSLLREPDTKLIIKLHRRESPDAIREAIRDLPESASVLVLQKAPLYPLLRAAAGAVIFASTVGLEALVLEVPLAVLEIPGHGFLHDFVEARVAEPLQLDLDLGEQVASWLRKSPPTPEVSHYLDRTLAHRGTAAKEVAHLIETLLSQP